MPAQTGRPPTSSATHSGPHTTSAISGEVDVGKSTLSPTRGVKAPGSR